MKSLVKHNMLKVQQIHIRQENTHKATKTIHTANQQQSHTTQLRTGNKTHDTNLKTACTKG